MFKDIKLAAKLIKYGIQFKQVIVMSIIFFVIGIAFLIFGGSSQIILGVLYMVMFLSYLMQPYMSLSISKCVATSGKNRDLFHKVPMLVNSIAALIGYSLSVIIIELKRYVFNGKGTITDAQISTVLVMGGVLAMVLQLYMAMAYKKFIISMIIFFVVFFPSYFTVDTLTRNLNGLNIPVYIAIVIGYAAVLLGTALAFLAGKLTYKMPLDKHYFRRSLEISK